jgi:hypothetical protein
MADIDTKTQRISGVDFDTEFKILVDYFKFKGLTPGITRQYFERVRFYPLAALKFAISRHIEANRPQPSNFPTIRELGNLCADWLQLKPSVRASMMIYDRDEDFDYPVELMEKAHTILIHEGEEAFQVYANETGMPLNDRERVRQRYTVKFPRGILKGV